MDCAREVNVKKKKIVGICLFISLKAFLQNYIPEK